MREVNMFAKKFFSKPGAKQCKLKTFGTKENPEIVGEDGVVRKKYKTQQHEIHKCYICKEQRKAPTDKIYAARFYCQTCNPCGDTRFAICGEKTGRECFRIHKLKCEYEQACVVALPPNGRG